MDDRGEGADMFVVERNRTLAANRAGEYVLWCEAPGSVVSASWPPDNCASCPPRTRAPG